MDSSNTLRLDRRHTIKMTGAMTGAYFLGGCLSGKSNSPDSGGNSGPDSGDISITNQDTINHDLTVIVKKISNDHDDADGRQSEEKPDSSPLWKREMDFTIEAGEEHIESGFVSEPGAYFIEVQLDTGEEAFEWLGLYSAGRDGDQVAEAYIDVYINDSYGIAVHSQQSGA